MELDRLIKLKEALKQENAWMALDRCSGRIVSTSMTSVGSGPWSLYKAHFCNRLQVVFQSADANKSLESKHYKAIVHADFSKLH